MQLGDLFQRGQCLQKAGVLLVKVGACGELAILKTCCPGLPLASGRALGGVGDRNLADGAAASTVKLPLTARLLCHCPCLSLPPSRPLWLAPGSPAGAATHDAELRKARAR